MAGIGESTSCLLQPESIINKNNPKDRHFAVILPFINDTMGDLRDELREKIFKCSEEDFETLAMSIFRYQYKHNRTYQKYCQTLFRSDVLIPKSLLEIPYLPVSFYKSHDIRCGNWNPEQIFQSSSTGGIPSKHAVRDIQLYRESFLKCFQLNYGDIDQFAIIGLLPSYLEREGSSLITMVSELIKQSMDGDSGFYLYNHQELTALLLKRESQKRKTILFGVTFALLDFAESFELHLPNTVIIETGGMKGRGKEPTREEVHSKLNAKLGIKEIHSEYGMTEMLSQAYMIKHDKFSCPFWLRPIVREQRDPMCLQEWGRGMLNFIDLANLDTCSFIATDDIGQVFTNKEFAVFGRADNTEVRGCNLMVADFFQT